MNPHDETLAQELDALLGDAPSRNEAEPARLAGELAHAGQVLRERAFRRPRDEARFVAGVLARTTREDLSWRGDLRLWREFLGARLKASPALRLVAASLALHLVATPALAWWILHEREEPRAFTLHIELPSELPFVDELPPPEEPADELRTAARAREARENERARLRHALLSARPAEPILATEDPVLAALAAHLEALRTRRAPAPAVLSEGSNSLARILALELALDRLWFAREQAEEARLLAAALVRESAGPLAASALRRAWTEGVLDEEPPLAPAPFSAEWFDALERTLLEEGGAGAAPALAWCQAARPK